MNIYHQKLLDLKHRELLRITSITGTQRSGSTVAAKAFAQIFDVVFDEVVPETSLADFRCDAEDAEVYNNFCKLIYDRVAPLIEQGKCLTVVVKNTCGRMGANSFQQWVELPSSFVVTFRDPVSQYISLARAFYGRGIANTHTPPPTSFFIDNILASIEDRLYPRTEGNVLDVNQKRWNWLCREIETVRNACAVSNQPFVFLESTLMRYNPGATWFSLLSSLEIDPLYVDFLLRKPWEIDISVSGQMSGAFRARVSQSAGFEALSESDRIDLERIPARSRHHIMQLFDIYQNVLSSTENAFIPTPNMLETHYCYGTGLLLEDVNLYVAKAVADVWPQKTREFSPLPESLELVK